LKSKRELLMKWKQKQLSSWFLSYSLTPHSLHLHSSSQVCNSTTSSSVCVWEREREREERKRYRLYECVLQCVLACVYVRERGGRYIDYISVYVCVRESVYESVCVWVCLCEGRWNWPMAQFWFIQKVYFSIHLFPL